MTYYYLVLRLVNVLSLLLVAVSVAAVVAKFPAARLFAVCMFVLFLIARRRQGESTAYGSSRWASAADLPNELVEGPGLCVGKLIGSRITRFNGLRALFSRHWPSNFAVRWYLLSCHPKRQSLRIKLNDAVHTVVVAPTGAGKGTSIVIPELLSNPDSMVVVDIKGENYLLTAAHRANAFGHKIVVLDPFNKVTHGD